MKKKQEKKIFQIAPRLFCHLKLFCEVKTRKANQSKKSKEKGIEKKVKLQC